MNRLLIKLTLTRLRESILLTESILLCLSLIAILLRLIGNRQQSYLLLCKAHRSTRRSWLRQILEIFIKQTVDVSYAINPSNNSSAEAKALFGSWALILKRRTKQEKGALYVMFSESLSRIRDGLDIKRLLDDYILIFEPSWSGYCDPDLLHFTQYSEPIFVLAAELGDYEFLTRLKSNLVPIPLGPCDWVNPSVAEPYVGRPKEFDLVMNSNWGPVKRHHLLFRTLAEMHDRLEVALIGGPWGGGTLGEIDRMAAYYGVKNQLTIFESIPYSEVMRVTSSARLSILLSRKEGSNRALTESIFCDVPVLLIEEHVGGVRKNIVPETGWIVPERKLTVEIPKILAKCQEMSPRKWGLENISFRISGERMNIFLKDFLTKNGFRWDGSIVDHSNSPDLTYECSENERILYRQETMSLTRYLRN